MTHPAVEPVITALDQLAKHRPTSPAELDALLASLHACCGTSLIGSLVNAVHCIADATRDITSIPRGDREDIADTLDALADRIRVNEGYLAHSRALLITEGDHVTWREGIGWDTGTVIDDRDPAALVIEPTGNGTSIVVAASELYLAPSLQAVA